MAYTLGNKCAKNCCKRSILVDLSSKLDVVICFFFETVYMYHANLVYCRFATVVYGATELNCLLL